MKVCRGLRIKGEEIPIERISKISINEQIAKIKYYDCDDGVYRKINAIASLGDIEFVYEERDDNYDSIGEIEATRL